MEKNLTLEQLVSKFEENDLEINQVPQHLVDQFGYACLANSLMFREPQIPKYNLEVSEYIKNNEFSTLESLISYIKNLSNDIDKLFGIFSYAALNIEYNVELLNTDESQSTSLEEVFITKKAICKGYAIFYEGMIEKVGIDMNRIKIFNYPNLSKGRSYDPLKEPEEIRPNHASMFIKIDDVPFISEPTWASGHLTKNKEFERSFRPNLFLIPLYKSLCDHFPCDEASNLLDFKFTFSDFFCAIKIDPFGRYIKTESNPFVNITTESGYIQQTYSCIGPIDDVGFELFIMKENDFKQISVDGITSYEIVQTKLPKHQERCRFKTHILFPEVGFYKVDMFIDTKPILTYYVKNKKKCSGSIPIQYNPYHDVKFIPITPKCILTTVPNGAIIRFAVAKKKSNLLWKLIKLDNEKSFDEKGEKFDSKYGKYIKLEIPFDNERYEIQLCLTFPSNGRYCVIIYFENELKKYSFIEYTKYFFDVIDIEPGKEYQANPIYYMFKGRKFAPIKIFDDNENEVIVKPNRSCYLVNEREQSLRFKTASINDELYFEFRKDGKTIIWPKVCANDGEFRKIHFTIPDNFGEYNLKGWVNDSCCIDLYYVYTNSELKEPSASEENLLEELKRKITHDHSKNNNKNEEEKKENEINIIHESEHSREELSIKSFTEDEMKSNSSKGEKINDQYDDSKIEKEMNINIENNESDENSKDENIFIEDENKSNSYKDDKMNFEDMLITGIDKSNKSSKEENKSKLNNNLNEIDSEISKENEKLKKENDILKRALEKLLKENKKLKKENEGLKNENEKLKSENIRIKTEKEESKINNKNEIKNSTQLQSSNEIPNVTKEKNSIKAYEVKKAKQKNSPKSSPDTKNSPNNSNKFISNNKDIKTTPPTNSNKNKNKISPMEKNQQHIQNKPSLNKPNKNLTNNSNAKEQSKQKTTSSNDKKITQNEKKISANENVSKTENKKSKEIKSNMKNSVSPKSNIKSKQNNDSKQNSPITSKIKPRLPINTKVTTTTNKRKTSNENQKLNQQSKAESKKTLPKIDETKENTNNDEKSPSFINKNPASESNSTPPKAKIENTKTKSLKTAKLTPINKKVNTNISPLNAKNTNKSTETAQNKQKTSKINVNSSKIPKDNSSNKSNETTQNKLKLNITINANRNPNMESNINNQINETKNNLNTKSKITSQTVSNKPKPKIANRKPKKNQ